MSHIQLARCKEPNYKHWTIKIQRKCFKKLIIHIQNKKFLPKIKELWSYLHMEEINETLKKSQESIDKALIMQN
uniref:Uncharacterized protein n=1 Tax=Physcomitrium patens TaxID=3218 RepID=A0A2K1JTZ7_PHYPA|nr:hypothetical protein PHYPA_014773 [Physcomitrium patens]